MGLRALAALLVLAGPAAAEPLRVATYDAGLSRKGPGLLLRDLGREDAQIDAAVRVIADARPDILLLTGFDWDHDGLALTALRKRLTAAGAEYPHSFSARPNAGMVSGLDLDRDGRLGGPGDNQGFGFFTGQKGMAILSRHPIGPVADHSAVLWRDLPGHIAPPDTPPEQRLSSVAHWDAVVSVAGKPLHLLAMAASPPVFDGPEDRNGRRNHDELAFWQTHLPDAPFVLLGKLNVDPVDGDGRPEALAAMLAHVTDTLPRSDGGAAQPGGVNDRHKGDPALDTANWPADKMGNLRVDYVLPAKALPVLGSGVVWPGGDGVAQTASVHRLVWVDIDWR
ncbi:endonuclease/exonuclease/phosphatase family protein [Paracoccus laeviglucosivorans]|uniref:Endonuclease/Exonuclease/phosphatase family protein n=1 Tax=Paracoccus laeviglucosivorans TaxID=1197861 RepID=A0A521DVX4_9RHOB|nr:endonuclease/exonuclease/phosphatase family protein [Paracoccus laeviglucosivorans]SMO75846.1 Endonuclease/Exonuclease/phosphatase family protein [Paracoccus laeviglucosivorans]